MILTQLTETLVGFSILLIIPVLLYLLLFRNNKSMSILFSIIVGDYILSLYMIVFGILHLFNAALILTLSIITAILIWLIFKDKLSSIDIDSVKIDRSMIFTVLLFAVFILAIQLIIVYPFSSDTFCRYLPWGRIIANEHNIPAFHLQNNPSYVIGGAPLLYTHIALIFSLVGINAENLSIGVPLFFSAATIFLIYTWSKEYDDKSAPLFAMLALVTSTYFLGLSPLVQQEAPVLFFATASFYLFFKYIKTRDNLHLILLSASSVLLILSKESGLIIATLIFLGLLVKCKSLKEARYVSIVFILLNILPLTWIIRNFYYYENPVPMLSQMFGGELAQYKALSIQAYEQVYGPLGSRVRISLQQFIRAVFTAFPAIIFALLYLFRNIKKFESQFIILNLILLLTIIRVATTGIPRYLYLLEGVLAVFAAIEMSKIYDWIFPKVMIQNKRRILNVMIIVLMIAFISVIQSGSVTVYSKQNGLGEENDILDYLQQHEGTKDVRIFGNCIPEIVWYGNYTAFMPFGLYDLSFILINEGKPVYWDETSDYYYTVFKRANIDYVYANLDTRLGDQMFYEINNDKEHFELVFNGSEIRLWKVK